ncbi:trypsin-1-like [Schistocerca serialis cubense]|uniref:trypsin-1-like n=1 Tax=Schistocerca serialis cubense TaxID=2023355 RepID=UPI00214E7A97|nr:trypsin-1-like [Schistocerca serialis cubense]
MRHPSFRLQKSNMMRQTVLVLALAACVLAAELPVRRIPHSGPQRRFGRVHGRIVGGSDATLGQFPYQVSLQWVMLGIASHTCGGSIVSANAVVTAGHCLDPAVGGYYEAVAGINSLTSDSAIEQRVQVAQEIRHPSYQEIDNVAINDVAVFQLQSSLTLGGNVQAIPLPTAGSVPSAGSSATLSGWGSTSTGILPHMPDILQWVDVSVISNTECALLLGDSPLNDDNVCTGPVDGSISACKGDSGGPLAQDGALIGIVSWGMWPCGAEDAPSVFTRVAAFTDFINQYI